ncbi:MAG: hypothetical protein ABFD07_13325 [Methanobacterium sp.]
MYNKKTGRVCLKPSSNLSNNSSLTYPEWIPNSEFNRTGSTNLIIWDETEHKSTILTANKSISLLHRLQTSDDWQINGFALTRKALEYQALICKKKKNRNKEEHVERGHSHT